MPQQQLKFVCELETYQIVLIGESGATILTYRTLCYDDDEAIDKLFAIRDVEYARFEILCGDEMISQGSRCR